MSPQITLVARDWELELAWKNAFAGTPVRVVAGSILEQSADAVVSPANSFGYMDGGLDLVYSQAFGWDVERSVREVLLRDWDGELPVGMAICVPMADPRFRFMISAPTMRVPSRVEETVNAYLAFRAVLRCVRRHNTDHPGDPIRTLACPGLGTGEGRMPADRCARQMRRAWDVVAGGEVLTQGGLAGAVRDHLELLG